MRTEFFETSDGYLLYDVLDVFRPVLLILFTNEHWHLTVLGLANTFRTTEEIEKEENENP